MSSTFKVEVVPVTLRPHPNADSLSLVDVYGYQVVVRTEDYQGVTHAAYIPPDSLVDTSRPEFAFLGSKNRIRAARFRGELSYGLLVKLPPGQPFAEGQDVAELLGVTHYQPPEVIYGIGARTPRGIIAAPPLTYVPKYDIENLQRYPDLFLPGETLWVTEKIDGANGRWLWEDGKLHCGSRNEWKEHDGSSIWSRVALEHPEIELFCQANPDMVLYGEVYGWVQSLKYGKGPGEIDYAIFDILHKGRWVDAEAADDILRDHKLHRVPFVRSADYTLDELKAMAEGPSLIPGADHNREGIVVKPRVERTHPSIGRVQLKLVSAWFLLQ